VISRVLHVFAFGDGLISREQVWIDSAVIVAQLTVPYRSCARAASAIGGYGVALGEELVLVGPVAVSAR
jgi:hypothetical protein